ncbi:hypothetical protein [Candidatus Williamhamiltonella defendens]|uniref:hypothetical protein n=1 Tax=Candidatus Williamhamiltonella defendens TaxID=138072 RepID=UPI0016518334|nr:hypothetical protein [Candidatus Hamiltonella defensa]
MHQEEIGKLTTLTNVLGRKIKIRIPVKRMILSEGQQLIAQRKSLTAHCRLA